MKFSFFMFVLFSLSGCAPSVPEVVDNRLSIRESNRSIVSACVSNSKRNDWVDVNLPTSKDLCRKPDVFEGTPTKYRIKANGDFSVSLEVKFAAKHLDGMSSETNRVRGVGQVASCIPLLKEVFARYNINFSMELVEFNSTLRTDLHQEVELYDSGSLRTNSTQWNTGGDLSFLCPTLVHEVSHTLGLPDEYYDSTCPDREFISKENNPKSIMATAQEMGNADLYPRHILKIVQPLCKD